MLTVNILREEERQASNKECNYLFQSNHLTVNLVN